MRRHWKSILVLAVLFLAVVWWRRGSSSAQPPEEKLASRIDDLCQIAKRHVDAPSVGVVKWFGYLGAHSPEMLEQLGVLLVEIERIPDDRAHDQRARLAASRLHPVLQNCEKPLNDFFQAVEADPDANALFTRGVERFSRTLAILSGADPHGFFRARLTSPDLLAPFASDAAGW